MCGGPLRAARAEEGNPRPGLSLSGSASLLRLEASGLSRSGRAGASSSPADGWPGGDLSLIPYPSPHTPPRMPGENAVLDVQAYKNRNHHLSICGIVIMRNGCATDSSKGMLQNMNLSAVSEVF